MYPVIRFTVLDGTQDNAQLNALTDICEIMDALCNGYADCCHISWAASTDAANHT